MTDRVLLDPELSSALASAGLDTVEGLLALDGGDERRSVVGRVRLPLAGTSGLFHLKRYRYGGWSRSRHLLGRGTLWGDAPEINEFRALAWLRGRELPAVRPVAAASRTQRGRLVAHLLLTEHWAGGEDLAARMRAPSDAVVGAPALRRRLLRRIGTCLGRMHGLGFVHRDAHARNVLVRDAPGGIEIALLDCRRGGPKGVRHGPLYDLATLDLDLDGFVSRSDRLRLLEAWRRAAGGAVATGSRRALVGRTRRLAARLARRDVRRGRVRR